MSGYNQFGGNLIGSDNMLFETHGITVNGIRITGAGVNFRASEPDRIDLTLDGKEYELVLREKGAEGKIMNQWPASLQNDRIHVILPPTTKTVDLHTNVCGLTVDIQSDGKDKAPVDVTVKTSSGSVRVDGPVRTAELHTMSGSIDIRECHSVDCAKTMSGSIRCKGVRARQASSMSGSVVNDD